MQTGFTGGRFAGWQSACCHRRSLCTDHPAGSKLYPVGLFFARRTLTAGVSQMTKFQSVIMGASIVLGCLILGLTLNSPAIGQGPSAPGKYQMMAAGDHGEIRVVLCNPMTGECWSKSTSAQSSAGWHYMSSRGGPDCQASTFILGGQGCCATWVYRRQMSQAPTTLSVYHPRSFQGNCNFEGSVRSTRGGPGCYCNLGLQEAHPQHGLDFVYCRISSRLDRTIHLPMGLLH